MTKRVKLITTEEVFKRLNHLINEPFGNLLNSEIRNLDSKIEMIKFIRT